MLPDFTRVDSGSFRLFPFGGSVETRPTTAQRMAVYREEAVPLAETAARRAMDHAGVDPGSITDLVITTCTGFFAPGPDVLLMRRLGLSPDVQRSQLGFMGCFAGVTGLRTAHQILQTNPKARVLLVSVELCSLHFQSDPVVENLIANILFADGASAAVIATEGPGARILATSSALTGDTEDAMGWDIGDHGFVMRLRDAVPRHLQAHLGAFVKGLGAKAGFARSDVRGWAVHPGGRRILSAVTRGLELEPDALTASAGVLRSVGNLSSATILFVLKALLESGWRGPGLALAFGPGLTMEGVALEA